VLQLALPTSLDSNLHQSSAHVQELVKHAAKPAADVPVCDLQEESLYLCEWVLL